MLSLHAVKIRKFLKNIFYDAITNELYNKGGKINKGANELDFLLTFLLSELLRSLVRSRTLFDQRMPFGNIAFQGHFSVHSHSLYSYVFRPP